MDHRHTPPALPRSRAGARTLAVALAASLGLAGAALGGGCGDSTGSESTFADPCTTVFAGQCGKRCVADEACASGLHCGLDGHCTADCAPGGAPCGAGQHCSPRGLCGLADRAPRSGGGLSSGSNTSGAGGGCPNVVVTYEKQIPTVMLLVDQSGSMTEAFGGGSRWSVLHDALLDPSTGIVATLESEVRFGLALYTSNGGSAGGACPTLTEVPVALGNYAAIKAVYDPASPEGDTPTGESIAAVATQLGAVVEEGPKVIVLATDGEPDTCAEPNPQNGQPQSIAAAQAAFAQGIRTYIISVGADVRLGHRQDIANAGAGKPVGGADDAPYYQALDPASLAAAFDEIINGVRSCVFTLNGSIAEQNATQGTVSLDGQPLAYGDPDGWKLNGPSEIEITGAACDAIQSGDHTVAIEFPCGTVDPPN